MSLRSNSAAGSPSLVVALPRLRLCDPSFATVTTAARRQDYYHWLSGVRASASSSVLSYRCKALSSPSLAIALSRFSIFDANHTAPAIAARRCDPHHLLSRFSRFSIFDANRTAQLPLRSAVSPSLAITLSSLGASDANHTALAAAARCYNHHHWLSRFALPHLRCEQHRSSYRCEALDHHHLLSRFLLSAS